MTETNNDFENCRRKVVDLKEKRVLIANLSGSEQEKDLTLPANCDGYGRIRHFRRHIDDNWPKDPLPIEPACKALNLCSTDLIKAQVFQIAACNWRCWYCFVPYKLLSADHSCASWFNSSELIDLYLRESDRPLVIDLSGGNPELVPEWVLWLMTELKDRGLAHTIYLWSDDNLSTDFFWGKLSDKERSFIAEYPNYGRVCCFKGFDNKSFSFNTGAEPISFDRQFELMSKLLESGIDLYAYVTFTTPSHKSISDKMRRFVDRLQSLSEYMPLRTIPLKIKVFTPVEKRINSSEFQAVLNNQQLAVEAWEQEIENRFTVAERSLNIADVQIGDRCK